MKLSWHGHPRVVRSICQVGSQDAFVPIPGSCQGLQNPLDLVFAAGFESDIDQSVSQADAVISTIELQFDNVGVVCRDDFLQLVERPGAIGKMNLETNKTSVFHE